MTAANRPLATRHLFRLTTFVAAVLVFLPHALEAQDWAGRGRLQGRVMDTEGEPIAGASVKLHMQGRPDTGPPPFETDNKGRFSYLGLVNGPWVIVIEKEGYLVSEGTVPVSEFGTSGRTQHRITLTRVEDAAPAEGDLTAEQQAVVDEAQAELEAARALIDEGNALLGAEDPAGARAKFEEALGTLPDETKPLVLMGVARTYYLEDDIDQAIGSLDKALLFDPENVDALKLAASLLTSEGRTEEAQKYVARLPEGEGIDPDAMLNAGIDKYNTGDLDAAIAQFDQVVAANPDYADAYYYRGLSYLGQAKNAEAIADFEAMLELAPDHPNAGEATQFLEYLKSQ